MSWHEGSTTDYRDLVDLLEEFATNDNVQTVAVNAGGTGYVVGDILTVAGGTSTTAATLEVTSVAAGVIDGIRVRNGGAYTVDPTLTANAVTGGTGSGATMNLTMQASGWVTNRKLVQLGCITVQAINNGGSGYIVNDIVTLDSSGDPDITAVTEATFRVQAVDGGGAVTAITVETPGEYSASDGGAGGVATTGGTGTGLIIDPFFDNEADETELLLQGSGSGADEIYVGIRTFTFTVEGAKNWELAGMTGFDTTQEWQGQPGISPGRWDNQSPAGGCFVPLRDVAMNYWMSINSRRIIFVVQAGSTYHSGHLGFIDPFATSTQYPYPLYIAATSSEPTRTADSADAGQGGFPDPVADGAADLGPGNLRTPSGAWRKVTNAYDNSGNLSRLTSDTINMWPFASRGSISLPTIDNWVNSQPAAARFSFSIIERGIGTTPDFRIEPTPGTGDAFQPMFPCTLLEYNEEQIYGQVAGVFWVSTSQDGGSSAVSGDTFVVNGDRFRVFQNVSRTEIYNFFCLKEE